jgi:hypothetical protein
LREKRLKEYTFEKMLLEKDDNFSPLTDEEDLSSIEKLRSKITDEESKKKAIQRHELKKTYYEAKYQFKKKKLEET